MARLSLLLLSSLFLVSLISDGYSRVTTVEEENIVNIEDFDEPEDNVLEKKIQELKDKVKILIDTGKENEQAFISMSEKVKQMDSKVKEMTERLRKVNQADYLTAGAEEIQKL